MSEKSFLHKLSNWYFTKDALPYWCILVLDSITVVVSYLVTFVLFRSGAEALSVFWQLFFTFLIYLIPYWIGFRLFHTYSGILRYSSFIDLQHLSLAMIAGGVLSFCLDKAVGYDSFLVGVSGTEILVATVLATCAMIGLRILVKLLYDVSLPTSDTVNAFILGVRNEGIGIAKKIRNEKPMHFLLKGFVSDNDEESGKMVMGVKVYPLNTALIGIMKAENIRALIITQGEMKFFRQNEKIQNKLLEVGIKIYVSKNAQELDEASEPTLNKISIEDLLPRDEISIDMHSIEEALRGRSVLITGSAGSIGSEMVRQIAKFAPANLILVDQAETPQHDIRLMMKKRWPALQCETIVTSITHQKRMEAIFHRYHPDYVFHAAAYKHVPMMEDNPCESIINNVYGTKVLADLSVKYGVRKFVMISTDKAVNPTNVMGCSKRICEIYVQSLSKAISDGKVKGVTQFVTTRFGNVLGSSGSVIPLFKKEIAQGGPVTVTDPNVIRYFMLIPEACQLVLEAGVKGEGGQIFVFDMGKPVKIDSLAKRMIKLSGAHDVKIKYVGLRAGEKLYEEVLNKKEEVLPAFNSKIFIAKVRQYDYDAANEKIERLIDESTSYDDMATVKMMKEIVPEYISNNSVYSELDNDGKATAGEGGEAKA